MGKVTGFLEYGREFPGEQPAAERVNHFHEFTEKLPEEKIRLQGARCMDCGIPFCQPGCPLGNVIPEWNDRVYQGRWQEAVTTLHSTNNFPEITGRVCPAPCEHACVLGINNDPVTIKQIEKQIADYAFAHGGTVPKPSPRHTGRKVAVIGSGPAGLAAAQQLVRAGHEVVVFEKDDRIGGLLRYGIPDFKLEKYHIDLRLEQLRAEGVRFETGVHVGVAIKAGQLRQEYEAIVLATGAQRPRPLAVPGQDLKGVYLAMDYLTQQNRRLAGDEILAEQSILATGQRVVIIGGGDTGADCVGTANRQGAREVHQIEILPRPPEKRPATTPWPMWSGELRTSTSHLEGCQRQWSVLTKALTGDQGRVTHLHAVRVEWVAQEPSQSFVMKEIPASEFTIEVDLVLLAMGFVSPIHTGLLDELGIAYDRHGNVKIDHNRMTSVPGVFAAGDVSRGASLVVWAIADGRQMAQAVDRYLTGMTWLL